MAWFSARFCPHARRYTGRRSAATPRVRLRVDGLEERLPPGDLLLARVLGPAWLSASRGAGASGVAAAPATPSQAAPPGQSAAPAVSATPAPGRPQSESHDHRGDRAPAPAVGERVALLPGAEDPLDPLGAGDLLESRGGSRAAMPTRHLPNSAGVAGLSPKEEEAAAPATASPSSVSGVEVGQPGMVLPGARNLPQTKDPSDLVANALPAPLAGLSEAADAGDTGGPGAPPPRARVHALFGLDATTGGPFPSDRFTVADHSQNTDRRVNLPSPDCSVYVSDCQDIAVINELDGFNLQPRLSVPFDGPIDVNSVSSRSMFLVSLGDTLNRHDHGGQVVGINQVVWDTFTNTLHVESDQLLDQHTRYALIVTDAIHDPQGHPVGASREFQRFHHDLSHSHDPVLRFYGEELEDAVRAARRAGVREQNIVDVSVFTTESATAILEKIRDQIHAAAPEPADFNLGPHGERTVFSLNDLSSLILHEQTGDNPPSYTDMTAGISKLRIIPNVVGRVAFGRFRAPDYETHPGEFIPPVGTRTGVPVVQGANEVYFDLFLPSSPKPANGWPVAIFGPGSQGNKDLSSLYIAASMAAEGIATIVVNSVGNGYGPLSTLTIQQADGETLTFPTGGRGFDQNGDHIIGVNEGFSAASPRTIIRNRDGVRQTVVELMQTVRMVEVGVDVDGDGTTALDPSRIFYSGHSQGAINGAAFLAIEPDVRTGVLICTGGSLPEYTRLSALNRPTQGNNLATRTPPLINSPGLTSIGGVAVAPPYYNENLPLRDQPPVVNTVDGAVLIQQFIENAEWVSQAANPVAFAPHLRKTPLAGVPAKSLIIQFYKGDQQVPNPTTTAFLRAGDLADRSTYYRHDLAFAEDPTLPKNPHSIVAAIEVPGQAAIALGTQAQIATFFASDGTEIIHPEPARFFETPIQEPLPEGLNYIV